MLDVKNLQNKKTVDSAKPGLKVSINENDVYIKVDGDVTILDNHSSSACPLPQRFDSHQTRESDFAFIEDVSEEICRFRRKIERLKPQRTIDTNIHKSILDFLSEVEKCCVSNADVVAHPPLPTCHCPIVELTSLVGVNSIERGKKWIKFNITSEFFSEDEENHMPYLRALEIIADVSIGSTDVIIAPINPNEFEPYNLHTTISLIEMFGG